MSRFLEEFKKFSLIEKGNLLIINILLSKEIYSFLAIEYFKYAGNPEEQKGYLYLSLELFILMAASLFIPYYFQVKSSEMQWLKNSDDPKVNLFVSKTITSIVLSIMSVMLIYNSIKSHH